MRGLLSRKGRKSLEDSQDTPYGVFMTASEVLPTTQQADQLPAQGTAKLCKTCQGPYLETSLAKALKGGPSNGYTTFQARLSEAHGEPCDMCKMMRNIPADSKYTADWMIYNEKYSHGLLKSFTRHKTFRVASFPYIDGTQLVEVLAYRRREWPHHRPIADTDPVNLLSTDWKSLKRDLTHCQNTHTETCNATPPALRHPIKLIDCESRKIEPAPGHNKFVALSYVWGPPKHVREDREDGILIPTPVENTIEDAILVTKAIGYKYIWVDRFCIDQADPNKYLQLQQMDLIYRNADITIVAAAGIDHNYGLPGVRTSKQLSYSCKVGKYVITEIANETRQENLIRESKWNSRGWTYQEALFSRRRLVFTDQGVSLYCAATDIARGSNSLAIPRIRSLTEKMPQPGPVFSGPGTAPWDIGPRITEYSQRTLTHDSDILNAFLGILDVFEHGKEPVYHLWGTPIFPLRGGSSGSSSIASDGLLYALDWRTYEPTARREGFPSWSWTGWHGRIDDFPYVPSIIDWKGESGVTVSVELSDCQTPQEWSQLVDNKYFRADPGKLSRFLHVDAWTVEVTLVSPRLKSWRAGFPNNQGELVTEALHLDNEMLQRDGDIQLQGDQSFLCLFLGPPLSSFAALIVQKKDGFFERVGIIHSPRFRSKNENGLDWMTSRLKRLSVKLG